MQIVRLVEPCLSLNLAQLPLVPTQRGVHNDQPEQQVEAVLCLGQTQVPVKNQGKPVIHYCKVQRRLAMSRSASAEPTTKRLEQIKKVQKAFSAVRASQQRLAEAVPQPSPVGLRRQAVPEGDEVSLQVASQRTEGRLPQARKVQGQAKAGAQPASQRQKVRQSEQPQPGSPQLPHQKQTRQHQHQGAAARPFQNRRQSAPQDQIGALRGVQREGGQLARAVQPPQQRTHQQKAPELLLR